MPSSATADQVLTAAAEAGTKLWLSGHYHGNARGVSASGIEVVTTSACGGVINWTLDPSLIATQPFPDFTKVVGSPPVVADARHSGMRLVRVSERGFTHRWFELADVPPTFDDAFAPRPRWQNVKERYGNLADVMGLGPNASAATMRSSFKRAGGPIKTHARPLARLPAAPRASPAPRRPSAHQARARAASPPRPCQCAPSRSAPPTTTRPS